MTNFIQQIQKVFLLISRFLQLPEPKDSNSLDNNVDDTLKNNFTNNFTFFIIIMSTKNL